MNDDKLSPLVRFLEENPGIETIEVVLTDLNGIPWGFDPRVVLKNVVGMYLERGLTPVCAPELEAEPPTRAGPEKLEAVLPATWEAALKVFAGSAFIRNYLGADLRQALTEIKSVEQREFSAAVTRLEYDTYLVLA